MKVIAEMSVVSLVLALAGARSTNGIENSSSSNKDDTNNNGQLCGAATEADGECLALYNPGICKKIAKINDNAGQGTLDMTEVESVQDLIKQVRPIHPKNGVQR